MSEKIETIMDVENRITELGRKHPYYKYIPGVGFYWDVNRDEKFIEYCRLMGEHERLLRLAESITVDLM